MATNLQERPETGHDTTSSSSVASLLAGIVNDAQELIKQQLALFKHEFRQDLKRAEEIVLSFALALPCVLVGSILLCLMVVALLHEQGGLQWWASFGIVGGVILVVGVALALVARQRLEAFTPLSDPSAEALKENLEWTTKPK